MSPAKRVTWGEDAAYHREPNAAENQGQEQVSDKNGNHTKS